MRKPLAEFINEHIDNSGELSPSALIAAVEKYGDHRHQIGYEEGLKADRFISMEKQKPLEGEDCLFIAKNAVRAGYYEEGLFSENYVGTCFTDVKLWQPLPLLPVEQETKNK